MGTSVLMSFGQDEYVIIFPYLTPILGTIAKPLIGMFSDMTVDRIPRIMWIIVGAAVSSFSWIISAYLINYISVIVISTVVCDIAAYFVYSLAPALFIERYGLAAFAHSWGLTMGGFALMTTLLLYVFGFVYDSNSDDVYHACYGLQCYMVTFLTSASVSVLALFCACAYLIKRGN